MIRTWRHRGLEKFFATGSKKGIQPKHAEKLSSQLSLLHVAKMPQDMNRPGWNLHELKGKEAGQWSVWVSGNWRITFAFDGKDAILVDYRDYH